MKETCVGLAKTSDVPFIVFLAEKTTEGLTFLKERQYYPSVERIKNEKQSS